MPKAKPPSPVVRHHQPGERLVYEDLLVAIMPTVLPNGKIRIEIEELPRPPLVREVRRKAKRLTRQRKMP